MDMNLETNPLVKMLGQESDIAHLDEAVAFFFALSVVRSVNGAYVSRFLRTLVRMYGALAFVMPLMLGGLPSEMMRNMDDYARTVLIAMVVDNVVPFGAIHPMVGKLADNMCDLSYAIMKANACAAGYAAFGAAFSGSVMAPFLGAFIATNGHQLVEKGIDSLKVDMKKADSKLAVCGGMFLFFSSTQMGQSALVGRAMLAFLNATQSYVPYDDVIKQVTSLADNVQDSVAKGISSVGGRSRSRTPARTMRKK